MRSRTRWETADHQVYLKHRCSKIWKPETHSAESDIWSTSICHCLSVCHRRAPTWFVRCRGKSRLQFEISNSTKLHGNNELYALDAFHQRKHGQLRIQIDIIRTQQENCHDFGWSKSPGEWSANGEAALESLVPFSFVYFTSSRLFACKRWMHFAPQSGIGATREAENGELMSVRGGWCSNGLADLRQCRERQTRTFLNTDLRTWSLDCCACSEVRPDVWCYSNCDKRLVWRVSNKLLPTSIRHQPLPSLLSKTRFESAFLSQILGTAHQHKTPIYAAHLHNFIREFPRAEHDSISLSSWARKEAFLASRHRRTPTFCRKRMVDLAGSARTIWVDTSVALGAEHLLGAEQAHAARRHFFLLLSGFWAPWRGLDGRRSHIEL